MSFGLLFWVLMILSVLFGFVFRSQPTSFGWYGPYGDWVLILILFGLLGWATFGPPLHG